MLEGAKFGMNMQEIGVCYAFVEFEDLFGVQNALKVAHQLRIAFALQLFMFIYLVICVAEMCYCGSIF